MNTQPKAPTSESTKDYERNIALISGQTHIFETRQGANPLDRMPVISERFAVFNKPKKRVQLEPVVMAKVGQLTEIAALRIADQEDDRWVIAQYITDTHGRSRVHKEVALDAESGPVSVGRLEGNAIGMLADPTVSRKHLEVGLTPEGDLYFSDEFSSHGTSLTCMQSISGLSEVSSNKDKSPAESKKKRKRLGKLAIGRRRGDNE